MRVLDWPGPARGDRGRCAATLGVFDGVHRGHQEVLKCLTGAAAEYDCPSVVVTFDRHPAEAVSGGGAPSITSLAHRLHLFELHGIDECVVVRFDSSVATMAAETFVRRVFHDFLAARLLVLGFDSRFGRGREGDVDLCRSLGRELGFEVITVAPVVAEGEEIHSTDIRQAILSGDLARVGRLLGRPFSVYGTVVEGDGRGQSLDFPTANLDLHNEAVPPDGVYACLVAVNGRSSPGVLSIGRRATFHHEPHPERVVEVHLLDACGNVYGQDMEVRFAGYLRGQQVFADGRALSAQIARDIQGARGLLEALDGEQTGER